MDPLNLMAAIQGMIDTSLGRLMTSLPGEVQTYDSTKRKASVKPMLQYVTASGEAVDLPVIHGVPVVWPSVGAGRLRFPIAKGDCVLLVFSTIALDTWAANAKGTVTTPENIRSHSLMDAVAIPGLIPFPSVSDPEQDGFEIHYDGKLTFTNGTVSVVIDGSEVKAAGTASLALADHTHLVTPINATPLNPALPVTATCGPSDSNTTKLKGS